jgi:hypothetical protein
MTSLSEKVNHALQEQSQPRFQIQNLTTGYIKGRTFYANFRLTVDNRTRFHFQDFEAQDSCTQYAVGGTETSKQVLRSSHKNK